MIYAAPERGRILLKMVDRSPKLCYAKYIEGPVRRKRLWIEGKWKRDEMKKGVTANSVLAAYEEAGSIKGVEKKLGLSWQKIARCLVDSGICPNNTCAAIQMLSSRGKSRAEICEILDISIKTCDAYMPYRKGPYRTGNESKNARRIERYRARKAQQKSIDRA